MGNDQLLSNSKLFKLKKWLTMPETANHLSIIFGEKVVEADVLRLGLEGHLKLSVNFVNKAKARQGTVVSYEYVEWQKPSLRLEEAINAIKRKKGLEPSQKETLQFDSNMTNVKVLKSLKIDDERFLNLEENVTFIQGVWDLPMIGNERLDVEHEYQQLTGGPEVTLTCLDGTFVEGKGGVVCQLQDKSEPIEIETLQGEKITGGYFYPAGALPHDSVFVVRTQALADLQERLFSEETTNGEKSVHLSHTPFLNTSHTFYAKELKIAVEAWTELYEKNPPQHIPQGGHIKYITNWLQDNYPALSNRALERIRTIVNPNQKGGSPPTPE